MKQFLCKSGLLTLALGAALTGAAHAQNAPRLVLNDQPLRTQIAPVTQQGRVLVPLRDIFENLGARVRYDDFSRTISARRGATVVEMRLGSRRAQVNGATVFLDVPATTVYGRTLVPLRFVSEALGAQVGFNSYRNVVRINDRNGARYPNDGDFGRRDRRNGDRFPADRPNEGRFDGGRLPR